MIGREISSIEHEGCSYLAPVIRIEDCGDFWFCNKCGQGGEVFPPTPDVPPPPRAECDGRCVMASDLIGGMSPHQVAYPYPGCPLHWPEPEPPEVEPEGDLTYDHAELTEYLRGAA